MSDLYSVPIDDSYLWKSSLDGGEKAFEQLYNRYYDQLFNYGFRFTQQREIIREAIQTLFIKIWDNRATLKETASVKYYLLKSFRRNLFRKLEQEDARYQGDEGASFEIQLPHEHSLISLELHAERKEKVDRLLAQLTNRQREAIYLRFYENLSYEEIATILEMQVGGAYKLIYRALDRLRETNGTCIVFLLCTKL